MIDTLNTILNEYYQKIEIYQKLKYDVTEIISTLIRMNNIPISNMTLRIKTEEALRNKVISKAKYHHLEDITDVLGCRIITLFESDIDRIVELLTGTFDITETVDKRKKQKVNNIEFGYTSLHLVVKFTDARCSLVEYQKYAGIRFEIQLRTVLQHAWAEVEHGLGYKSFYEPPMEIKRKLNRLAATLEILDEEFDWIRAGIEKYNQSLDKEEKVLKTDINKDSLIAYVEKSPVIEEIAQGVANKFGYRLYRDTELISQQKTVVKLNFYGYQYINELNTDIIKHQKTIQTIGESLSDRIVHETRSLNVYSVLTWFTFIPVIKSIVIGHGASSEEISDDLILKTFQVNSGSILSFFTPETGE